MVAYPNATAFFGKLSVYLPLKNSMDNYILNENSQITFRTIYRTRHD
jgi:hypothetical protein